MNEDGDFEFIEDDQKPVGSKKTSGQSTSVGTKSKELNKDIANIYGIHASTVSDIRRGKIWKHVIIWVIN